MLADILGKSLIRRTYENALRCKSLDNLVVVTDDTRIFEHVKQFGAKVLMTSTTCATGTDRIAEAVNSYNIDADIIVNIQGDEPCLNPAVVDALVSQLQRNEDAFASTTVVEITDPELINNPSIVKCVFDLNGKALYFSRSPIPYPQKSAVNYHRHLGVYCFRKDSLLHYAKLPKTPLMQVEDLEQLKILEHGFSLYVSIVEESGIGVDTKEDLKRIEAKLCQENTYLLQEESSLL